MPRCVSSLVLAMLVLGCGGSVGVAPDGGARAPGAPTAGACAPVTSACVPLDVAPVPPAGGVACSSTAGACSPQDVTTFKPAWVPPVARLGQCTSAQIAAFFAACIDAVTGQAAACEAFRTSASNATCVGCLVTDSTASAYGASIAIPGVDSYQINAPGCIALAEPCNQPCAEALLAELLCGYASCDPAANGNCAVDSAATLMAEEACFARATTPTSPACACMGYAAAAACKEQLSGLSTTKCGGGSTEASFKNLATFMCGPCGG